MAGRLLREGWSLGRATVAEWLEDKAARLGAALAFYSVLSLAPFVVIAVGIAGIVYGDGAVGAVQRQFESLIGPEAGRAVAAAAAQGRGSEAGWIATAAGVATLLLGASGVFGQLQDALNAIWEVEPPRDRGILGAVRARFFSFTMVLGTGFLLLLSLLVSAALAAAGRYAEGLLPGGAALWQALHAVASFGLTAGLFALIFRVVPDARIAWRDALVGGAVTALLFAAGKLAIGVYLGRGGVGSAYGAAGALLVLLVWVYYSAQILFLGAEFTQVFANRHGARVVPVGGASPASEARRAEQGLVRRPREPARRPSPG